MPKIIFTPERKLNSSSEISEVKVKGQSPSLTYPFQLRDIYPTIESLEPLRAYQNIAHQFDYADSLLHGKYNLRESIQLPSVQNDQEALSLLGILFDPTTFSTNNIWVNLATSTAPFSHFIEISQSLPFPLKLASDKKLLHTLAWVDTNIKVNVEQAFNPYLLPEQTVIQVVLIAFNIYSLLLKQQNYRLARSINFNYSMFIQDRIVNLLLGDKLFLHNQSSQQTRYLSNLIALKLLYDFGSFSFQQLCLASLFMGVIWTSDPKLQKSYTYEANTVLADLQLKLLSSDNRIGVNHIDFFLDEVSLSKRIVVILDDNGESVFDLALFQKLLSEFDDLVVIFVVNRFPVSNNISEGPLKLLLRESYFQNLNNQLASGRAQIVYEQQVFRSFEHSFISPETISQIKTANFLYIKGVNFFETMQFPDSVVYHAFVVHGEMSATLTGYPEGVGIFVRIPPKKKAYKYIDAENIITLREQLPLWKKE